MGLPRVLHARSRIKRLVGGSPARGRARCGVDLFREICRRDLEGIVAKWKHGTYVSGDVTSWVKIKNPEYSQAVGRFEQFQRKRQGRVYAERAVSRLAP